MNWNFSLYPTGSGRRPGSRRQKPPKHPNRTEMQRFWSLDSSHQMCVAIKNTTWKGRSMANILNTGWTMYQTRASPAPRWTYTVPSFQSPLYCCNIEGKPKWLPCRPKKHMWKILNYNKTLLWRIKYVKWQFPCQYLRSEREWLPCISHRFRSRI